MPMNFPDMQILIRVGKMWKFREPSKDEAEIEYRNALADFVSNKDFIESEEIRNGIGWDKWNKGQKDAMLGRFFFKR